MQSFDFKKFLPHLLIVLGFFAIALIYCHPVLEGKILSQGDIVSWKGMSQEPREWHEKTGESPLWSNSMFGGMPTFTYYIYNSSNYIGNIYNALDKIASIPANFFFLAMLSFYVLMCTLRVNRWLAVFGAIAFAFCTFMPVSIVAGHNTKVVSIAYMPLALSGMLLAYRGRYFGGGALLAFALALMLCAGHYQIIFYLFIIMLIAGIGILIDAVKKGTVKSFIIATVVCLVAGALALGSAAGNILSTQEYVKQTMRGGESELTINHDKAKKSGGLDREYAFQWSNGIGETFCVMIPYLYGGSDGEDGKAPKTAEMVGTEDGLPLYWGDQPFLSGPVYFGAIICFLFVLGLLVVRSSYKWWILAASALAIMMSWGRNFPALNNFLFDHLPMYNKFRTPTMTLAIAQLLFPMLGIWGLSEILKASDADKAALWKKVKIALGITAGLCVLIAIGGSMFFDYSSPNDARIPNAEIIKALKEDRSSLAMKSAFQSAVYILLAGGLIWAFLKNKVKANVVIIGVGLLIVIDLFVVSNNYLSSKNYIDQSDYDALFQPRPVDQQILQDKDPYYRVLDLSRNPFQDAMQAYFHKCIGGYSPAKLEIYQDMIDVHMTKGFNGQVLNMLNTKYIIAPNGPQNQPVVIPNAQALGNAWFVNEVKWAKTADEEILSLKAPNLGDTTIIPDAFDPRKTAVIRETFQKDLNGYTFGKDSAAKVVLSKYGLNELEFTSHNSQNGLAVFSDIYYPYGWKAYIDGNETPILKANYILRALKIPAGDHKIEFRFHPDSYYKGDKLAMFGSLLLIIAIIAALFFEFKNRGKNENQVENI